MCGFDDLIPKTSELASYLRGFASTPRILVLCKLLQNQEMSVSAIKEALGMSPSALSQHLAKLRALGVVGCRRRGHSMMYRLQDPRVGPLLTGLLYSKPSNGRSPPPRG